MSSGSRGMRMAFSGPVKFARTYASLVPPELTMTRTRGWSTAARLVYLPESAQRPLFRVGKQTSLGEGGESVSPRERQLGAGCCAPFEEEREPPAVGREAWENTSIILRLNAGMSAGLRLETRPS